MKYIVSADVIYSLIIEADSDEEAIQKFEDECPYDIDGDTIWGEEYYD